MPPKERHARQRTIAGLRDALSSRATTSTRLVEEALRAMQDPAGDGARSFTQVHADSARASAGAADTVAEFGNKALAGVPIAVKDLFDVAGEPTWAGSKVLRPAAAAARDALVVSRLRAAGAIVVGKCNMSEFAFGSPYGLNPHFGTPINPFDRASRRAPGGSSSGCAVAVADGTVIASIGSDTGGSIRIPAALCGVVGFKPTARRIPLEGCFPLSPSMDSIGPIAQSTECCALLDSIMADQPLTGIVRKPPGRIRLAVPENHFLDELDAEVATAFERCLARLASRGVSIVTVRFDPLQRYADLTENGGIVAAEAWALHRDRLARHAAEYDPALLSRLTRGSRIDAARLAILRSAREQLRRAFAALAGSFDALLVPTVGITAPRIADLMGSEEQGLRDNARITRNPSAISFLDGCALSIPCHAPGTAPKAISLVGSSLQDARVLGAGLSLEETIRAGD